MTEQTKRQTGPWVFGAAAAALLAAFVVYVMPAADMMAPEPAPVAAAPAPVPAAAVPVATVVVDELPAPVPDAEPVAAVPLVPVFDTFRLDPDGAIVVAGRAEPGQVVDLLLGQDRIASTLADGSGSFVMLAIAPPADMPRRLSLVADPDGVAVGSQTSYLVGPIAAPVVVAAVPDATPTTIDAGAMPEPAEQAPEQQAEQQAEQATAEVAPDLQPASPPVVLQADADGLRVVQGGGADLPAPNVALDAITYDPDGTLQLAGRATGTGDVQIYLDDTSVATAPVTAGRDWRIDLPGISTGIYTLRIDELDSTGTVVSRLETPFRREEPATVAAVMADQTGTDGFDVAIRTVQPGSTLWAIAEESLGSGIFFVQVFEANSDLIRNPDLIYPGQVFRIPQLDQ